MSSGLYTEEDGAELADNEAGKSSVSQPTEAPYKNPCVRSHNDWRASEGVATSSAYSSSIQSNESPSVSDRFSRSTSVRFSASSVSGVNISTFPIVEIRFDIPYVYLADRRVIPCGRITRLRSALNQSKGEIVVMDISSLRSTLYLSTTG
jgi:hypothetical protein